MGPNPAAKELIKLRRFNSAEVGMLFGDNKFDCCDNFLFAYAEVDKRNPIAALSISRNGEDYESKFPYIVSIYIGPAYRETDLMKTLIEKAVIVAEMDYIIPINIIVSNDDIKRCIGEIRNTVKGMLKPIIKEPNGA
jgi:hypothetical protein